MGTSFAETFGRFVQDNTGAEVPESKEKLVDKEIPFGTTEIVGSHAKFTFSLEEDDAGDYVRVSYGFGGGHNFVTPPVVFRDRRAEMVAVAVESREYLDALENNRTHERLARQLEDATEKLRYTEWVTPISGELSRLYGSWLSRVTASLDRESEWTEGEKEEWEILIGSQRKLQQILADLEPSALENDTIVYSSMVEGLSGQLEAVPQVEVPEGGTSNPEKELYRLFSSSPGVLQAVTETERISGTSTQYLEIIDLSTSETDPEGHLEFESRRIHISKFMAPATVALFVKVENILGSHGSSLFGEPADSDTASSVEESGGIYQRISYSSGTGRHQGFGSFTAVPKRSESPDGIHDSSVETEEGSI
ncbi:hypothetical protein JXA34_00310 [Patescibacteria group bacterium]|nr:hypothetical protein [Patescibacteria group bacterium]